MTAREIQIFHTRQGLPIARIPLEVFPDFWAFAYFVQIEGMNVLIDTGSAFGESNHHLEAGLRETGQALGQALSLDSLTHILITHGHIDHFGGLAYLRDRTPARIGVHELDKRNLSNYEERVAVVTHRLSNFLLEAGLSNEQHAQLIELYRVNKTLFRSVPVDFTYEQIGMRLGPIHMLHVPGHCAGQTVFRLHDMLIPGDHVLSKTTPHMAPESLTLNTGLGHYLQSLDALAGWVDGVTLTLPAHEAVIEDLPARIRQIKTHHKERLDRVRGLLATPHTIAQVSEALFGQPEGYNALLAIEEAGAHVEYLYQRGELTIANYAEYESRNGPVPLQYVRCEG